MAICFRIADGKLRRTNSRNFSTLSELQFHQIDLRGLLMHSLSGIRNTRVLSRFHRIDELALARRVDGGIGMFCPKKPEFARTRKCRKNELTDERKKARQ